MLPQASFSHRIDDKRAFGLIFFGNGGLNTTYPAKLRRNGELNLALVEVPTVAVSGPNPLEVPGRQTISLAMHQAEIDVGYAGKY